MSLIRRAAERIDLELQKAGLKPRPSFGMNAMDRRVADIMKIKRGVFIEAGANDGFTYSNTLYLEKYLGWTGLLVEPVPEVAAACARNRPKATVRQCALVPRDFPASEIKIHACNLMSVVDGSFREAADLERHLKSGRQFLTEANPLREVMVPARPLSTVIDECGFREIDFLSLDVEGFEVQVLRGLDLARHAPKWMLIETDDPRRILEPFGATYEFAASLSKGDQLFKRL